MWDLRGGRTSAPFQNHKEVGVYLYVSFSFILQCHNSNEDVKQLQAVNTKRRTIIL